MHLRQIIAILSIFLCTNVQAQFGYGFTLSNDLYHRYVNPKNQNDNTSRSSGSAILNLGAGPKIWIGNAKRSFSLEGQAVFGILSVASKDSKGLGSIAFPLLAKMNFKGLSCFDREGKMGFSIGGGVQFSKTEFYGLSDEYIKKGVQRTLFTTYLVQVGYGFGISGFTAHGIVRYGFNNSTSANTLNIGLQYDFNSPMYKKISSPESSL